MKLKTIIVLSLLAMSVVVNGLFLYPYAKAWLMKPVFKGYADYGEFEITAYDNSAMSINVAKWRDGKTHVGMRTHVGIVASDPRVIPTGSTIYIKDLGYFYVADIGSAIKFKRLDLFFWNNKDVMEWGRRKRKVYVVKLK